ncbi:MAG: aconitase X swivel domain-containing protein [Candidatus Bathycorpusculaceae bacterium]
MRKIIFKCRPVLMGVAEGEALVTEQPLCLYDSLDPKSGVIMNRRHELYGENVSRKVLIFPYGIGSTTSSATILEASRCNNAPNAIINLETEPTIAIGALLAERLYGKIIPIVDKPEINPADVIKKGDLVKVDAEAGLIEVIKRQRPRPRKQAQQTHKSEVSPIYG